MPRCNWIELARYAIELYLLCWTGLCIQRRLSVCLYRFVFLIMWGPIIFTAMLPCIFSRSEHISSNSSVAHSLYWELLMSTCCTEMQIFKASTTTYYLIIRLTVLQPPHPGDSSHVRHSSPQLLPWAPQGGNPKALPDHPRNTISPTWHSSSSQWTWLKHLTGRHPGGVLTRSETLSPKATLHVEAPLEASLGSLSELLSFSHCLLPKDHDRSWSYFLYS